MSEEHEAKRIRLRNFGRAWDEYVYRKAMATNSVRKTALALGIEPETVRSVVAYCNARRARLREREFA